MQSNIFADVRSTDINLSSGNKPQINQGTLQKIEPQVLEFDPVYDDLRSSSIFSRKAGGAKHYQSESITPEKQARHNPYFGARDFKSELKS